MIKEKADAIQMWKTGYKKVKPKTQTEEKSINNIDIILDKLKLDGWDGLTDNEKSQLYKAMLSATLSAVSIASVFDTTCIT